MQTRFDTSSLVHTIQIKNGKNLFIFVLYALRKKYRNAFAYNIVLTLFDIYDTPWSVATINAMLTGRRFNAPELTPCGIVRFPTSPAGRTTHAPCRQLPGRLAGWGAGASPRRPFRRLLFGR